MMTESEYKETLVRMFDSLRTGFKGIEDCVGIKCINCPFYGKSCDVGERVFRAYEAIEIIKMVEKWEKRTQLKKKNKKK